MVSIGDDDSDQQLLEKLELLNRGDCDSLVINRNINMEEMLCITHALKINKSVKGLEFYNEQHEATLGILVTALEANETLEEVVFSAGESPEFAVQLAQEFGTFFGNNKGNLKSFAIIDCGLSNADVAFLVRGLETNSNLEQLQLGCGENVGVAGATAIASLLTKNKHLKKLELRFIGLSDEGFDAIAKSLGFNTSLEEVDLSYNHGMVESGVIAIAASIKKNNRLKILKLAYCGITEVGAAALAEMLEVHTSLEEIDLSNNNGIADAAAIVIAASIKKNNRLKILNLFACNITEMGAAALAESLKFNTSLEEIWGLDINCVNVQAAFAKAMSINTFITQLHIAAGGIYQNAIDHCGKQNMFRKRYVDRNRDADFPPGALPLVFERVTDRFALLYLFVREQNEVVTGKDIEANPEDLMFQHLATAIKGSSPLFVIKTVYDQSPNLLKAVDTRLMSPLHWACASNASFEVTKFLLKKEPKAAKKIDRFGRTALHLACATNTPSLEVVKLLTNTFPDAQGMTDHKGNTPLFNVFHSRSDDMEVIKFLLTQSPVACLLCNKVELFPWHVSQQDALSGDDLSHFVTHCTLDAICGLIDFAFHSLRPLPPLVVIEIAFAIATKYKGNSLETNGLVLSEVFRSKLNVAAVLDVIRKNKQLQRRLMSHKLQNVVNGVVAMNVNGRLALASQQATKNSKSWSQTSIQTLSPVRNNLDCLYLHIREIAHYSAFMQEALLSEARIDYVDF